MSLLLSCVCDQATAASYLYDALGRVTAVTDDNGLTTAYVYDAAGNRSTVSTAATPATGQVAMIVPRNSAAVAAPLVVNGAYTSVAVASQPAHGTATVSGASISYRPTANFSGADQFTYTASNGTNTSAPATVSISVPPHAEAVSGFVVVQGTLNNPVPIVVDGAFTSVGLATLPGHGTAVPSSTSIIYTPTASYTGADSFTYTASNAVATSAPANIAVTVSPGPPIANPVSASVPNGTTHDPIPLNITGGAPTSVAVANQAVHGVATASGVTISYSPNTGYVGSDSFTYTAANLAGTSAPAQASITVTPLTSVVTATLNCPPGAGSYVCYSGPSNGNVFTANPATVSVTGGSGSYSYQWNVSSNGGGTWAPGGTASSFTPSVTEVKIASMAAISCTVTDNVSGLHAPSTNSINYRWQNTGGGN